jgi:hypothetical protein
VLSITQALLADAAEAAPSATLAASVFVTTGSSAAVIAASAEFAMSAATAPAHSARTGARQAPYMVPPDKHTATTKLSFVRLSAEQHHRAHVGGTAGRTGLLALTRQLTSAPKAARVSHTGTGVAQDVAGAGV